MSRDSGSDWGSDDDGQLSQVQDELSLLPLDDKQLKKSALPFKVSQTLFCSGVSILTVHVECIALGHWNFLWASNCATFMAL